MCPNDRRTLRPGIAKSFFVLLILLACAPRCAAQAPPTVQDQIRSIDTQIQCLNALLAKYNQGGYYLTRGFLDTDTHSAVGLDQALANIQGWGNGKGLAEIIVPMGKDYMTSWLILEVASGEMKGFDIPGLVRKLAWFSKVTAASLKNRLTYLKKRRLALLHPVTTSPATTPCTSGCPWRQPSRHGYWRLKDGFPKIHDMKYARAGLTEEWTVGPGSVALHEREFNATTNDTINEFTVNGNYAGLGKTTYDAGEEFKIALDGSWTWGKDAGRYNVAYLMFEWTTVYLQVLKADPRLPNKSLADSAVVRLGRVGDTVIPSEHRDITAKLSGGAHHGQEFSYSIGLGLYGDLVTWTYEWVDL